ncbi:MAG: L-dopachrome tautomerase-related protein [Crocosphaera sp.]|nr:L-dopachrome tautomerase-related protein [Crocosphaera sp.]
MPKNQRKSSLKHLGIVAGFSTIMISGCQQGKVDNLFDSQSTVHSAESFTVVARSPERQWTGVAVSDSDEIFVNFPKWVEGEQFGDSVAKLVSGKPISFPNSEWNQFWTPGKRTNPSNQFVSVQAVYVDDRNYLWILDTGNPNFEGLIPGATKLIRVDLSDNSLQVIPVDPRVLITEHEDGRDSYINDIRVDVEQEVAYISDSEQAGLIIVENIYSSQPTFRRVLDDHPSKTAEAINITINGEIWGGNEGSPRVHSDGIALHPSGSYLCYQALTATTTYCAKTKELRDPHKSDSELGERVFALGVFGPADGLLFDDQGRFYHSSLELNAVRRVSLTKEQLDALAEGVNSSVDPLDIEIVAQDPEYLAWPDSFSQSPDGSVYVTASRIHQAPRSPYYLVKLLTHP